MRSGVVLTVGLALTLLAGCGQASPVSPGGSVAANLILTDVSVIVSRFEQLGRVYWAYYPRFRIIETSGRTGAVIASVVVKAPFPVAPPDSQSEETGELCWRSPVRVEAGGTLLAFFVDPYAPGGLYYCAPSFSWLAAQALPSILVTVIYVDDHAGKGQIDVTIPIPPQPGME